MPRWPLCWGMLVGRDVPAGWPGPGWAFADPLSRPVLVGYMSGVAIILIASQLGKLTGVAVKGEEFVALI